MLPEEFVPEGVPVARGAQQIPRRGHRQAGHQHAPSFVTRDQKYGREQDQGHETFSEDRQAQQGSRYVAGIGSVELPHVGARVEVARSHVRTGVE